MEAANKLGIALAQTDMVPKDYKGKPDNATAAILFGAEIGLSPLQALQNIFIVNGKPAVYARTMAAQVISAGHKLIEIEAGPGQVTWAGERADSGERFESTWTIERATKAGFTSNAKYKSQPTEMLRAKAIAEVCRSMAPEVLVGMPSVREELELEPRPVKAKAERIKPGVAGLRAKLDLPPIGDENMPADIPADTSSQVDAPAAADESAADKPSPAQTRKVMALLRAADVTERDERLALTSHIAGRGLDSFNDLSPAEAGQVIEVLENLGPQGIAGVLDSLAQNAETGGTAEADGAAQ